MINPYDMPKRVPGRVTPNVSYRINPNFTKALDILAKRENERLKPKIAPATLIINLMTHDSNFFRTKRRELREIYEQLNREQQHVTPTKPVQEEPST